MHPFIFLYFSCIKACFFLLGRSNRKSVGAVSQWRSAASQRHSQHVKISPAVKYSSSVFLFPPAGIAFENQMHSARANALCHRVAGLFLVRCAYRCVTQRSKLGHAVSLCRLPESAALSLKCMLIAYISPGKGVASQLKQKVPDKLSQSPVGGLISI